MEGRVKTKKTGKGSLPKVGNIKIGQMIEKNGKTFPSSTDYFIPKSKKENYNQMFRDVYGDKPDSIRIIFFSEDLKESCWEEFQYRDSQGKNFAYGDGENYFVYSQKEKQYKEFSLSKRKDLIKEIEERSPKGKWSHILKLKFFIVGLNIFGHWEFDTRAELTSIPQIRETFDFVKSERGKIMGVEFDLNVVMAKSDKPGDMRKFPVVVLVPIMPEQDNLLLETPIKQIEG